MRKIFTAFFLLTLFAANAQQHLERKLSKAINVKNKTVLIAAHRGDWRNAPENSIQSLKFCIEKGYDIVECDLKRSKDGHLIIMHDKTINRTTTGKGKPEDYLLSELKNFKLLSGTGHPTEHEIPTLEEFLAIAKDKVLVCIDKGFEYFNDAMLLVKKYKMTNHIIYNIPAITLDSLQSLKLSGFDKEIFLNILGFPLDTAKANHLANSYLSRKKVSLHPTFNTDTIPFIKWMSSVKSKGIHLWLNSLWPEHNASHDDDNAVERNMEEQTWGWLIKAGATIIQTDRPEALLKYLRKKKMHQ